MYESGNPRIILHLSALDGKGRSALCEATAGGMAWISFGRAGDYGMAGKFEDGLTFYEGGTKTKVVF